jgi:hypothetical protein
MRKLLRYSPAIGIAVAVQFYIDQNVKISGATIVPDRINVDGDL